MRLVKKNPPRPLGQEMFFPQMGGYYVPKARKYGYSREETQGCPLGS